MLDHCAQTILSPHSHLYISLEMSVVYHEHHTTTVEEEVDDDDEVNINVKAMGASLDAVVDVVERGVAREDDEVVLELARGEVLVAEMEEPVVLFLDVHEAVMRAVSWASSQ